MRLPEYSGPFKVGCMDFEVPVRSPRTYATDIILPDQLNKPQYMKPLRSRLRRWFFQRNQKGEGARPRSKAYSMWMDMNCLAITENHHGLVGAANSTKLDPRHGKGNDKQRVQAKRALSRVSTGKSKKNLDKKESGEAEEKQADGKKNKRNKKNDGSLVYGTADDDEYEDLSDWNPFNYNSKTSTLHLETVLFTLYYPSSFDPNDPSTTKADQSPVAGCMPRPYRYSPASWVSRPKRVSFGGLLGYLKQYGPLGIVASPALFSLMHTQIPVLLGAPLMRADDKRLTQLNKARAFRADEQARAARQREKRDKNDMSSDYENTGFGGLFGKLVQAVSCKKDPGPSSMQLSGTKTNGQEKGAPITNDGDYSVPEAGIDPVFASLHEHGGKKLPVVIFSHGLAGSRTSYSQYCGTLASHGVIVAAIEHRDGSALYTSVRSSRSGRRAKMKTVASAASRRQNKAAQATENQGDTPETKQTSNENTGKESSKPAGAQRGQVKKTEPDEAQKTEMNKEEQKRKEENFWEDVQQYKDSKYARRYGTGLGKGFMKKRRLKQLYPRSLAVPQFLFEKFNLRSFPTDPTEEESGLRAAQIEMRIAEIEETRHVLERIERGEGYQVYLECTRGLGSKLAQKRHYKPPPESIVADPRQLSQWKGRLDMTNPFLVGHSFGGCTVAEAQRSLKTPFPSALMLDPWTEPMSTDDDQVNRITAPLFAINSETFTVWKESFEKLQKICHAARDANEDSRGWILTVAGTDHLSFSDLPLILPHLLRAAVNPQKSIAIYALATYTQMGLMHQRNHRRMPFPNAVLKAAMQALEEGHDNKVTENLEKIEGAHIHEEDANGDGASRGQNSPALKVGGVVAHRSPSGNLVTEERDPEEQITFVDGNQLLASMEQAKQTVCSSAENGSGEKIQKHSEEVTRTDQEKTVHSSPKAKDDSSNDDTKEEVWDWDDAIEVLKRTQAISDSIASRKKRSILSLLGFLMSIQGLKPGLSTPGTILCHQY